MQKRCDLTIQAAANGYIVEAPMPVRGDQRHGGAMVFDTLERLLDYLRDHYAKTDPRQNVSDRMPVDIDAAIDVSTRWARPL